jgi:hypothetical protein
MAGLLCLDRGLHFFNSRGVGVDGDIIQMDGDSSSCRSGEEGGALAAERAVGGADASGRR